MNQRPARGPARFRRALMPTWMVGVAAAGSGAAHVVAAASGPSGAMAWLMAAMGAACLYCTGPLLARQACARRSAGHLFAMSAAMILIHLALLIAPEFGGHHATSGPAGGPGLAWPPPGQSASHSGAMLALIGVELLCLAGASAALRLTRRRINHHALNH